MKQQFETLTLHAGLELESSNSRAAAVHRTTAYNFKDSKQAADLFALRELGNIYTRLQNPTQAILEERLSALEGGMAALALASGTSAIFNTIINICKSGDHIVSSRSLYGGTFTMFNNILPDLGINCTFADVNNIDDFDKAVNAKTKLIFTEVIGNPVLEVADIKALSEVAKKHGIPLVVDSTFTTPYLFQPLEWGADIVVHSLTKWIGGHGTGIGGIVIDSGKFNWKSERFPLYNEEEASYHNLRFAHDLGELSPLAFILRMRLVPLRNLGACISPDNAWIFLQGLETLALRMQRHCENALSTARFLKEHPAVSWIRYPGLKDDPAFTIASRQFTKGFGGMIVFGIKGGREAGRKFIDSLNLFSHVANVGDAKSLAIHPASTTHSQLDEVQLKQADISQDMIRLSIGIEHIEDIRQDLDQALGNAYIK